MEQTGTQTLLESPAGAGSEPSPIRGLAVVLRGPSDSAPEEIVGPFTGRSERQKSG